MKILFSSLALLCGTAVLAAVALPPQDATPTRPEATHGLPAPSLLPPTQQPIDEANAQIQDESEANTQSWNWHDLLRLRLRRDTDSPPLHNTFTHLNATSRVSPTAVTLHTASASSTSATITSPATFATEIGVFTAAGAVFTVTEISGTAVAVDGKSLVPGGPAQLIGGEYISEGTKGNVVVNGQTVDLMPYSASSAPAQPSSAMVGASSISVAAGSSSSGATGGGGVMSSSTSGGLAPAKTAGVEVLAVFGAVVGVIVL